MSINCPTDQQSVQVVSTGTGSGSPGTICAHGEVVSKLTPETSVTVRVKVYETHTPTIPDTPEGASVTPEGGFWCARDLAVPTSGTSDPGAALTVVAWEVVGGEVLNRDVQHFYGRVGGGFDCCSAGPCGSGSGSPLPAGRPAASGLRLPPPPPPPLPPGST